MEVILPDEKQPEPSKPEAKPPKKKNGVINKLQEITPDKEEQIQIIGVAVRLGIVIWSGFCLTLAYIDLPGFPKQTFAPTFIASVFTGALSSFGLTTAKSKGNGGGITKADMEKMMAANQAGAGEQIIRIQTPIRIQAPDGGEIQQVVQGPPKPPAPNPKA